MSRTWKWLGIPHEVENGEPFTADQNLRIGIAVRRGGLRNAPSMELRERSILLDVTNADPKAQIHCEQAVLIKKDQLPLLTRRANPNTMLVRGMCPLPIITESQTCHFSNGTLRASRGRGEWVHRPAEGSGGEGWWVDGKERIGEGTPTPKRLGDTQVAHWRKVSRFRLQLRVRQESRRGRGRGDHRPTPIAGGWSLFAS